MLISLSVGTSLKLCSTVRLVLTSPCFVCCEVKGNVVTQVPVPTSTLNSDCFSPLDSETQCSEQQNTVLILGKRRPTDYQSQLLAMKTSSNDFGLFWQAPITVVVN